MKKNYFKKSLSLVLTVLMLMSCWVFVAPTEADAIDAGDAVTAYNKELLNQINTTVDTNMTKAYGKFLIAGNGDNGSDYNTTRAQQSYVNVLYSPYLYNTSTPAATFGTVTNADRVAVWYPTTVLMYDGAAARMAVLLEVDSSSAGALRVISAWMSANQNGLEFDGSYQAGSNTGNENHWKGYTDNGDSAHAYIMYSDGDKYYASANGTEHSSYKFNVAKGKWGFLGGHLKFTGTLSDTEWVRTIKPTWNFWGGKDGSTQKYTGTTNNPIYVMNIQGYKRLVQDIISKKGSLNAKEGQYTRDSLQRFVNACNKITQDLAPKNFVSTTSNNVTSWASQMSTAYTELNNAYNGLVKRNVNVGYENLFSISDWAQSLSPNLQSSSSVEIAVENNDTVKIYKNAAGGEVTTGSSYPNAHVATRYSIPVTGGKDYTVRYDIEASVDGTAQSEVFMFWYDANNNPVNNTAGSATFNNKGFGSTGACSVTFTAPASATKAEIRFDNDCPSSGSTLRFKNIAVYPAERNTAVEVDSWSTRPVMKTVQYGSTLSGKLDVPVRNGYTFNGWYIDNVNVNGVKDSGEEVTDAAGNVTKSVTVTNSINLYADWKPLPMDIGYDNIFSLAEWAKTGSTKASSANGTIAYDVMAGTITAESTANGEVYTNYGTGADQYVIAVKPNTEYIFEADMDLVTGDKGQMFVFFYNASGSGVTGAIYNGTAQTNAHIGIYPTTEGTSSITFTTPADCTKMAFRVGATTVGTKAVYSNIGFYKKADYDAYAKDYATIRVPFNFGDTTALSLVPTRKGYKFDGWYTADGKKLTSVDGLKASTTVYAQWTAMYTVTFKNYNGSVISTVYVAPGAAATAPTKPSRPAEKANEWTFDKWDTDFSNVQSDLTVTAVFKAKDHDLVKSYLTGANCTTGATYTQVCNTCNVTWTETFEDPARPALGHTYERTNPSSTVITGTSTGKADTDLHTIKCNACDATTQVQHDFKADSARPGTTATCTVKGWTYTKCACLETQEIEGQTNPDNHVNKTTINAKDPACGVEGYTGDTFCTDCKKTIATGEAIDALTHTYTNYVYNNDAKCGKNGTETANCDLCGKEPVTREAANTALEHSFTKYVDQGDATCDTAGTEIATCDREGCNETDSRSTGKTRSHDFTGAVKNNENGTHAYKCKYDDCDVYGEAVACTYGEWTKDNEATHSHTCTACGYTPAAEAHDWSAWTTVGGSATSEATQKRTCNVCGREETTECDYAVKDHKDATCEAAEITVYECSDCKHTYTEIGEGAKGHKFEGDAVNNGDGTHSFKCLNNCGEIGFGTSKGASVKCDDWTYANTEAGKHTATCKVCAYAKTEDCAGGTATCTAQALCDKCNTAYGEKAPHQFDGKEYFDGAIKAKDATCTEQAEYYVYCSACKSEYTTEETFKYGDLLAHDYTGNTEYLYKATDAKCGVNETYYVYCSACKKSSEGTNEAATFEKKGTALTHKFDGTTVCNNDGTHTITCSQVDCTVTETYNCADTAKLVAANAATCTEAGYFEYICQVCDYEWTVTNTEAPALGHEYTEKNYNVEAYVKVKANCDHGTIYWYGCAYCDKNAKDETDTEKYPVLFFENTNDKRAHSWKNVADKAYEATPATCTAAAKYYPSCSYEDCTAIDTSKTFSSGTALEHVFDKKVETYLATDADCVNNATYYYVCSRCDAKGTTTWEKENSKSGHSMTYTEAKAADCYNAGNYEYWYCATCKIYFKDELGTEAYANKAATVIAKRSHDIVKVAYKAPTCEVDGNPAYDYCKYEGCGYTTYPAVLPNVYKATGHNFTGDWTYDTVQLYHSKLCANGCGKSGMVIDGAQVEYEVTYNELDEAVVTGAVKCTFTYEESTVDGVHSHVNACVCGNNNSKTYTDEETFDKTVVPTCTDKGYDSYVCKDCGATWTKNEKAANGHTAADTATSNKNGTHSIFCAVEGCGYKMSTEKCSGGTATCSAPAVCDKCKTAYGEATGDHVIDDANWVENTPAKCGVNATEKNTCTVEGCDGVVIREVAGSALDHNMTAYGYDVPEALAAKLAADGVEIKEPTCGTEGLKLSYCDRADCDYYKTQVVAKDADSHNYVETTVGNCSTGVTIVKRCENCGDKTITAGVAVHYYKDVTEYYAKVFGSCNSTGYVIYKCENCNQKLTIDSTYPGFATNEATYETLVVDENGNIMLDDEGNPVVETVAVDTTDLLQKEHAWGEVVVTKESTCSKVGRGYKVCDLCKVKVDADPAEEGAEALRKKDHDLKTVKGYEATCTSPGRKDYSECMSCGYSENADNSKVIPAKGHTDVNGKCSVCGVDLSSPASKCNCMCHKESGFSQFIYKILRFFWKLFGMNKSCSCGNIHY